MVVLCLILTMTVGPEDKSLIYVFHSGGGGPGLDNLVCKQRSVLPWFPDYFAIVVCLDLKQLLGIEPRQQTSNKV